MNGNRDYFSAHMLSPPRKAISQWRALLSLRAGRPVPAANFHLTLLFLGSVDQAHIADICTTASKLKVPGKQLTLLLDRLEVWRKSKALVLTPEAPPP